LRIRNQGSAGIRYGKIKVWDPGSGINIPDHISESLIYILWVKMHKLFVVDPGFGAFLKPGSGMEKFASGINIPDPQKSQYMYWSVFVKFIC
jgi:hypothetical protein